ncbi:MAG: hypothetical protein LUF92_12125 [Clostridiales bacterium]|nr:hypothetical protein [Clostridiales bacterium]
MNYEQISHVYLAGEFGQKVNVRKAVGIGLLSMELADKSLLWETVLWKGQ